MLLKREGKLRPGVKVVGSILLLVTILAMLGGCAWLQDWLNPNHSPVAIISATPTFGEAPLQVSFDASQSYDPDGDTISYEWTFIDSQVANERRIEHSFNEAGQYVAQLRVIDSKGTTGTSNISITAVQGSEDATGTSGVVIFVCGQKDFNVQVIDETDSSITGITCSSVTDGKDAVMLLTDPSKRYIPRLTAVAETVEEESSEESAPKFMISAPKKIVLHSWDSLIKGGSHLVYDDLLPEGITKAYLHKNYTFQRGPVALDHLEAGLGTLVGMVLDAGADYLVTTGLTLYAGPAGPAYEAFTTAEGLAGACETFSIQDSVARFKKKGYSDHQKFEIWERKLTSSATDLILVLALDYPKPEKQLLPPSNLKVQIHRIGGPRYLSWDYASEDEEGFLIQQKTIVIGYDTEFGVDTRPVAGHFVKVGETGPSSRTHMVEVPLYAYVVEEYRLAAMDADGNLSEWSNIATPPKQQIGAPVELQAEVSGFPLHVKLSWKDGSNNESGFRIYRWTGLGEGPWLEQPNTPWPLWGTVDAGVEIFTDKKVKPGYTHRYFVIAFNDNKSSLQSNVETVFTSNQQPDADFTFQVSGLTVAFADTSIDDGNIVSWLWGFGDDNTSEEQNLTHTYSKAGTYEVTLTVMDAGDLTDTATQMVTITVPSLPDLTVTSVALSKSSAQVGETISVAFTVENKGGPVSKEFQNRV